MIYITGDTHIPIDVFKLSESNFPEQKQMTKEDFVIVCGDFGGVWNRTGERGADEKFWVDWLNKKPFTTLFVDGNHENHQLLNTFPVEKKYGGKVHVIDKSVYHLMRGEVFTLDNKKFFCMGGATSVDKDRRTPGISWWPEELPSKKEMDYAMRNLDKHDWNVDYIITHCAPTSVVKSIAYWYEIDSLNDFLQVIYEKIKFKHWFFGHYHYDSKLDEKFTAVYEHIVPLEVTCGKEEENKKR